MFRSRFSNAFPKSLPHYGPQDIERGVTDTVPGDHLERLLCALLGLVLNRKKDVEWVPPIQADILFYFSTSLTEPELRIKTGR